MGGGYTGHMRTILLVVLGCVSLLLGGCVFWDIRDEVRNTNSRLDGVEGKLTSTNEALDTTNEKLVGVTDQLKQVDHSLDRLDLTNSSLSGVQERLMLLRSLDASLAKVDVHLASLRKTIGRIDGMIPFLDLGTAEEPAGAAGEEPEAKAEAKPEGQAVAAKDGAGKDTGPARRDALLGVWVSQYPDRSTVIVLMEGGKFLRQRGASGRGPEVETGTWTREGKTIELTGEPKQGVSADGKATTVTARAKWDIVSQSVKSMAVRGAEDGIIVLAKP